LVLVAAATAVTLPPGVSAAQEFTRQSILVNVFLSADPRLGRAAASGLRSRISRLYPKRDVVTLGSGDIAILLDGSGIDPSQPMIGGSLSAVARSLRADEILGGTVEAVGRGVRLSARLSLVRDERVWEPLGPFTAPTVDSAVSLAGAQLFQARRQLAPHRRCENAVREGNPSGGVARAREGITEGSGASIVRTCLVAALLQAGADASEVAREADRLLATVPTSYWGLDAAARARDALGDTARAGEFWLRLAATDSSDFDLAKRVGTALLQGGNARRAQPFLDKLAAIHTDDVPLLRLRWQVQFTLRDWAAASASGERLLEVDDMSRQDSTFVLRLASALRQADQPVKALGLAARGVLAFPRDARLYVLYSQLVQGEAPVTVARGVERFPEAADLQLMHAQELRRTGRKDEAVAPLKKALALDPTLGQGYLQLAQAHSDMGMSDSALVAVRQALVAGEDSARVAQFALARGNALYRAANATKQREDFLMAMRFLSLADSVRSSPQSGFLLGVTALTVSQSAATDAPRTNACDLSQLASSLLPIARNKLTAGADVSPDAARQYLEYLTQLEPVVARQLETLCPSGDRGPAR